MHIQTSPYHWWHGQMHSIFAHCTASVLAHADLTQSFIPQPLFKPPRLYTDLSSVCNACSITRSLDRPIQTLFKQCKTWQPCSMNMLTAERPHTGSWQYSHQVKLMCPVVAKRFSMSHTHSDTGCIIQMPTGLLLLQGGLTLLHCYC